MWPFRHPDRYHRLYGCLCPGGAGDRRLRHRSFAELSGGEQQLVLAARALAQQARLLLMDEPTSALDPISTSKIEDLATELKKDYTIIMVTHNMQQAARISDKTAFFLLGELIEYGDTEQMFSMPQNKKTGRLHHREVRIMRDKFNEQLEQLNVD